MTEKAYGLKVCVDSISGSFLISRFCLTTLPQLDNYATPEVDEEEDVIQGGDEDDHVEEQGNLAGDEDDLVEDTRRSIPDWREVGREQQWATGGKWGFSISKY